MEDQKKRKVGRPTNYREEYCEKSIEFLKNGKSKIQLAAYLHISHSVLERWERNNPEFKAAIELGLTYAEAKWLDDGEKNIANKDYSIRMYELQMMNRFKWSRKIEEKVDSTVKIDEIKFNQEVRKQYEKDA